MVRTEVREEERVRIPREDLLLAHAPRLEVDVGRRRRRHHVAARAAADAGGVADERDARRRVEVRDVMRRVPGRVLDFHFAPDHRQRLASFDHLQMLRRHRLHVAPQPIHVLRVEPPGAGQELRRIGQVRRAAAVDDDLDVRVALDNGPHRARVIQVDVRHEDLAHVLEDDALAGQRRGELRNRRRRPRVDERDAGGAVQDRRGDDLRTAEEVEVDVVEPCGEVLGIRERYQLPATGFQPKEKRPAFPPAGIEEDRRLSPAVHGLRGQFSDCPR